MGLMIMGGFGGIISLWYMIRRIQLKYYIKEVIRKPLDKQFNNGETMIMKYPSRLTLNITPIIRDF